MDNEAADPSEDATVTFIKDEPATEDFFQTHTHMSAALATAILQNPKIRVVGLLGRWGSGKSTIIRYLTEHLTSAEPGSIEVFTYDAWLHQHDPVRRSFLETLIEYLIGRGFTEEATWKSELSDLRGQTEISDTKNTPVFVPGGRSIVLSLLIVPLGLAFLELDTLKEAFGDTWTKAGLSAFFFSTAVIMLPAFLFGLRWYKAKGTEEADAVLSLFVNQSTKEVTSRTRRDPEPSAIEFRRLFRKIMKSVTQNRRFVFIIDNLDRVDPADSLQMWATIRSFFVDAGSEEEADYESYHPTVVLPVDTEALRAIFASTHGHENAPRLATSFSDKTFDLTFAVPEPVMSDWRAYLARQMEAAFGNAIPKSSAAWLRRFFEESIQAGEGAVTPRQINKLVNRMVGLYLQRRFQPVSCETLAFYAVYAERAENGLHKFLAEESPRITPPVAEWQREVAALHYGVDVQKAAQVWLREPLLAAIRTGDKATITTLSQFDGFGETFERLAAEPPLAPTGAPDFSFVTSAGILLNDIDDETADWVAESWNHLIRAYCDRNVAIEAPEIDQRVSVFLSRLPSDQRETFIDATASKVSEALSSNRSADEVAELAGVASRIHSYSKEEGFGEVRFLLTGSVDSFLSRLLSISRSHADLCPFLKWTGTADEIIARLVEMIASPTERPRVPALVRLLRSSDAAQLTVDAGEIDWEPLVDATSTMAREPYAAEPGSFIALEVLGILIRVNKEAHEEVAKVADEGALGTRLSEANSAKKYVALSKFAALLIWRGNDFAPPSGATWAEVIAARPDLPRLIHGALVESVGNITLHLIWKSHEKAPTSRELLDAVVREKVENSGLGSVYMEDIFASLQSYLGPIPAGLRPRFVGLLANAASFWKLLGRTANYGDLHALVKLLSQRDERLKKRATDVAKSRLLASPSSTWDKVIADASEPWQLLHGTLKDRAPSFGSNSGLAKALSSAAPKLLESNFEVRKRWFNLLQFVNHRARQRVVRELGSAMRTDKAGASLLGLMKLGGVSLLKEGEFALAGDESVRQIVIPLLQMEDGRRWLRDVASEVKGWIATSTKETRRALSEKLRALQGSRVGERRYWAEVMRNEWGL